MEIYNVITLNVPDMVTFVHSFSTLEKAKTYIDSFTESQMAIEGIVSPIEKYGAEVKNPDLYNPLPNWWPSGTILYGTSVETEFRGKKTRTFRFVFETTVDVPMLEKIIKE